ncbi:MAG: hypothetical protein Q4C96_07450 [Planctomycetia bacterium]|nr:hypothetical protein [Planctomycetia bacterium]
MLAGLSANRDIKSYSTSGMTENMIVCTGSPLNFRFARLFTQAFLAKQKCRESGFL